MTITNKSMVHRVADTLQDATLATRWSTAELVRYENDGIRQTLLYRPDAGQATVTIALAAGARQALAATHLQLLDILSNTASKKAVHKTERRLLDAQVPGWRALTGVTDIVHFMYDPLEPNVFEVYPPATTSSSVQAVVSVLPAEVAEPTAGTIWSDVVGNFPLPDIFAEAVQQYMLYRAWTKDAEYVVHAQQAATASAAFAEALGIEIKSLLLAAPKP